MKVATTKKAPAKIHDYSAKAIAERLQSLYNMRSHWFMAKGLSRPEPQFIYTLEKLGCWMPHCKFWTIENLINKVVATENDIRLILPSATGKQATFRAAIENDIRYCIANQKEVQHGISN